VAYDLPTIDKATKIQVDHREDYYKLFLFKSADSIRAEKWSLLSDV
jgi:hypothetical protein